MSFQKFNANTLNGTDQSGFEGLTVKYLQKLFIKRLLFNIFLINVSLCFTADAAVKPAITVPAPGSVLSDNSITVNWEPNDLSDQVIQYQIRAGSTPGGSDYHLRTQSTNQPRTITGLPNDGSAVYLQLRYRTEDGWKINPAFAVTASQNIYPAITSPAHGSTLSSANIVVTWEPYDLADQIIQYQIRAGSSPGGFDYYLRTQGTNQSQAITGLPDDGSTVYLQLRYKTQDGWSITPPISVITGTVPIVYPAITSHASGSTLSAGDIVVSWEPNDLNGEVIQYQIRAGSAPGGFDYYLRTQGTNQSRTITGLPFDGSAIYLQLRYRTQDGWSITPPIRLNTSVYMYPSITSPTSGTKLSNDNTIVSWEPFDLGDQVIQYQIRAGSTPGGFDYYLRTQGTNQSRTITGLPNDGSVVYLQLRYKTQDGWSITPPVAYSTILISTNCTGFISDTRKVKIPAIAKPSYSEYYQDPAFKSKTIRITDTQQGEVVKPMYSTIQAWNADESLMILYKTGNGSSGHMLYDGNTYKPISQLDITPSDIEQIFWSHTDPDEFFYISKRASDRGEFKRYSVTEESSSYITDFKQYCGVGIVPTAGDDVHMQSLDDDLFAFRCEKDDGTHLMLSYRISTDEIVAKPIGEGTAWVDNIAPTPTPSGDRFWHQGYALGTDLETIETSLDLNKPNEHSNVGITHSGNDALYQIAFNSSPSGCNNDVDNGVGHLIEHDLETGTCRSIINEQQGYPYSTSATHISAQAYLKPGLVAMSSVGKAEQMETFFTGDIPSPALFSEIYLTDTDPDNQTTCRLAHHRSFGKLATNGGYTPYFGEPHVTISPSGTRILFGSDWYDSGSVDTYVIELPGYLD